MTSVRRCLTGLLAFAVAGCTLPSGARWPNRGQVSPADAPGPATVVRSDDLELAIQSEKPRYVVGEPVHLAVTLSNRGREPVRVLGELDPTFGAMRILIRDGRRSFLFVPLTEVHTDESVYLTLGSGQSVGDAFPIFFGASGWTFREPGEYAVEAIYQAPGAKAGVLQTRSTTLTITIEPTPDRSGAFLVGGTASHEAGKFLLWQSGDHLVEGRRRLEQLREQWPQSPLADYAGVALGKSFSEPFSNYREGTVRPEDCRAAMKLLETVNTSALTLSVRIQFHLARLRCELAARQWARASESVSRIRDIAGGRIEYERVLRRVSEYEEYIRRAS